MVNRLILALSILSAASFGSTLRCDITKLAIFAQTTLESVNVDDDDLVVAGSRPLDFVPEPGFSKREELSYKVSDWNWTNGLTISARQQIMTTGMAGQATMRIPSLRAGSRSGVLRVYTGTLSLLPTVNTVRKRLATVIPVKCYFRK